MRYAMRAMIGLALSVMSATTASATQDVLEVEKYDQSWYRRVYFCTDEELANFPDRAANAPMKPEMGRNYATLPKRYAPFYLNGVLKGVSDQQFCKESMWVERKAGEAAYAMLVDDLKARHPGAQSFKWYYAVMLPGTLNCWRIDQQALEIFHGSAAQTVAEPPRIDPVIPRTSRTDPGFAGVAGGNMSDGLTRGGASTGRTGFAEMNRTSFCRRDNRTGEALSRCLRQFD